MTTEFPAPQSMCLPTCMTPSVPPLQVVMACHTVINIAASTIGLSLATLSFATRLVAGEKYQARLDGFFGVQYDVRPSMQALAAVITPASNRGRRPQQLLQPVAQARPLQHVPHPDAPCGLPGK